MSALPFRWHMKIREFLFVHGWRAEYAGGPMRPLWWRPVRRVRFTIGRWLLHPELTRLRLHYNAAANENHRKGKHTEEDHCTYIGIGLKYAQQGWPHDRR